MSDSDSDSIDSRESFSDSSSEEPDYSEMTFGELKQIRKLDTTGSRRQEATKSKKLQEESDNLRKKRRDKDAPVEKSSKVYVSRYQAVTSGPTRVKSRDPRFEGDTLSEEQRADFRRRYSFIDKMQQEELKEIKKGIKKEKDEDEREKLKHAKNLMESRIRSEHEMDLRRQVRTEHNREQRLRAEQGRPTFFLKEHEIDRRIRTKKFEELQKKGAVDRYLTKKRKRQVAKDRKSAPLKRRKLDEAGDDSE